MGAMMTASDETVSMLLECGANVDSVDVMGNDAFMLASAFGRPDNLRCWLNHVKDWDINRQNTVVGGCALSLSVYMGSNKLETVKILLDANARTDCRTVGGSSLLMVLAANEDSEPDVARTILSAMKSSCCNVQNDFERILNEQKLSTTWKWRAMRFASKVLYRSSFVKSGLVYSIAMNTGTTALNHAIIRGDLEMSKLLLEAGADPYVKNDLGMNSFEICSRLGPFPNIMKLLKR